MYTLLGIFLLTSMRIFCVSFHIEQHLGRLFDFLDQVKEYLGSP